MAQNQKSNNSNKIFKCPIKAKIHSIFEKNPLKTTPKPLQIVQQSQTIPIESESPIVSSHEKEDSSSKPKRETITFYGQGNGQKDAKALASPRGNVEKVETKPSDLVSAAKTKSIKDDEVEENDKFTDYITRVKDRMRNVSNVGRSATRRDSFNDKVSNYINHARIKMRTTTTNVGDDKNV